MCFSNARLHNNFANLLNMLLVVKITTVFISEMFKLLMGVFLRQQVEDPPLGMPIPAPILNHPLYSDQRYRLKHLKIIQRLKVGPEKQHSSCSFRLIKRPQTVYIFLILIKKASIFLNLHLHFVKPVFCPA